jgi:hypothetical protein
MEKCMGIEGDAFRSFKGPDCHATSELSLALSSKHVIVIT